jgi:hypothetical protein
VDLTTTRAQAKGVAPAISLKGCHHPAFTRASQNMAATIALLDSLLPPSVRWGGQVVSPARGNPHHPSNTTGRVRLLASG